MEAYIPFTLTWTHCVVTAGVIFAEFYLLIISLPELTESQRDWG